MLATGAGALIAGCAAGDEPFVEQKVARSLREAVRSGQVRDLVVTLRDDVAAAPDQVLDAEARRELAALRRDNLAAVRAGALGDLPDGVALGGALDHLPFLFATVDSVDELDQLAELAEVQAIVADRTHALGDVHAAARDALAGLERADGAIAVLENGVRHPAVVAAAEIAADDGALAADGRGAALAADLVAANPAVGIVALDVVGADGAARTSDLLRAMDWVVAHQAEHDIAGVALAVDLGEAGPAAAALEQGMRAAADLGLPSAIARMTRPALNGASVGGLGDQLARGGVLANAAPTSGTVVIASNASFTKSASVPLQLSCTFGGAACTATTAQMCISNNGICSTWVTFAATKAHTLAAPDGLKTVTVFFREKSTGLQMSGSASDTITLDVGKPVEGPLTAISAGASSNALSWVGFSDATSGLDVFRIAYTANTTGVTTAPAAALCQATPSAGATSGTIEVSSSTATHTHSGLTAGMTYNYRLCARDRALNYSAGKTAVGVIPTSETVPPASGSVVIAGNAEVSFANVVSVALDADAGSGAAPTRMCVSAAPTCTAYTAFSATKSVTLPATSGLKTVYAYFTDANGNKNKAPFVDSIMIDRTVPVNGTAGRSASVAGITLNWAGFTDLHSKVVSYRVVRSAANGAAPAASCTGADISSATTSLSFLDAAANLTAGAAYIYRVCAVDEVGNKSTGALTTAVTAL